MNKNTDNSFFIPVNTSVHLDTTLRQRFDTLLTRIGQSQNWLADQVGVSSGTMSKIANGDWFPSSKLMVKICKILEIDSVALFGDSIHWKKWSDKIIYKRGDEECNK